MIHSRTLIILACLFACGCAAKKYELVRWPDGTNDCYAIELNAGNRQAVIIPTVFSLQNNERFISGVGSYRYLNGFPIWNGQPYTNVFWFVVDKTAMRPSKGICIATNSESWSEWCTLNGAPTNLHDVTEFLDSAPPYNGGGPQL